jgi:hypothetical protein
MVAWTNDDMAHMVSSGVVQDAGKWARSTLTYVKTTATTLRASGSDYGRGVAAAGGRGRMGRIS